MYSIRKMAKGFTLIELLIVIAIIGILAVAFLPALTAGPAKARDAARVATVNDIVSAIESLTADGVSVTDLNADGNPDVDGCLVFSSGIGQTLATEMRKSPKDFQASSPKTLCNTPGDPSTSEYYYNVLTDGYMVAAELELKNANNAEVGVVAASITGAANIAGALSLTDTTPKLTSPFFYIVAK